MQGSAKRKNGPLLIDVRDIVYFLDACVGLRRLGLFPDGQGDALRGWMGDFYEWLISLPRALAERNAANNLATNYFLIRLALARFLSDFGGVVETFTGAMDLLGSQLLEDGSLVHEVSRRQSLHYATFTLQLSCNFLPLAHSSGVDTTTVSHGGMRSLTGAITRHIQLYDEGWPIPSVGTVGAARIAVLRHHLLALQGEALGRVEIDAAVLGALEPHSAVPPGWARGALFTKLGDSLVV
jgi:hypothetical protein